MKIWDFLLLYDNPTFFFVLWNNWENTEAFFENYIKVGGGLSCNFFSAVIEQNKVKCQLDLSSKLYCTTFWQ